MSVERWPIPPNSRGMLCGVHHKPVTRTVPPCSSRPKDGALFLCEECVEGRVAAIITKRARG